VHLVLRKHVRFPASKKSLSFKRGGIATQWIEQIKMETIMNTATNIDKFWLKSYPPSVPAEIDVNQYKSLVHLL
jgi:hypothetical protein